VLHWRLLPAPVLPVITHIFNGGTAFRMLGPVVTSEAVLILLMLILDVRGGELIANPSTVEISVDELI
jgi:ABC-type Co2+ transport system permease subunit